VREREYVTAGKDCLLDSFSKSTFIRSITGSTQL
jgi:hypothetical protein